ncbi:unnamed protein product [Periconia digitata]|uniref:Zinc finger PHD-type domain-containing protein n=1 Tax=Periconia digitata TaxID=1303443 RepID=A0A9W4XQ30_9PLEO|nr:unnamed protein product [Periconia digitata]
MDLSTPDNGDTIWESSSSSSSSSLAEDDPTTSSDSDDNDNDIPTDLYNRKHVDTSEDRDEPYQLSGTLLAMQIGPTNDLVNRTAEASISSMRNHISTTIPNSLIHDEFGNTTPIASVFSQQLPRLQAKLWREWPQTAAQLSSHVEHEISQSDVVVARAVVDIADVLEDGFVFVRRDCCGKIAGGGGPGRRRRRRGACGCACGFALCGMVGLGREGWVEDECLVSLEPLVDWMTLDTVDDDDDALRELFRRASVLVYRRNSCVYHDFGVDFRRLILDYKARITLCVRCLGFLWDRRVASWCVMEKFKELFSGIADEDTASPWHFNDGDEPEQKEYDSWSSSSSSQSSSSHSSGYAIGGSSPLAQDEETSQEGGCRIHQVSGNNEQMPQLDGPKDRKKRDRASSITIWDDSNPSPRRSPRISQSKAAKISDSQNLQTDTQPAVLSTSSNLAFEQSSPHPDRAVQIPPSTPNSRPTKKRFFGRVLHDLASSKTAGGEKPTEVANQTYQEPGQPFTPNLNQRQLAVFTTSNPPKIRSQPRSHSTTRNPSSSARKIKLPIRSGPKSKMATEPHTLPSSQKAKHTQLPEPQQPIPQFIYHTKQYPLPLINPNDLSPIPDLNPSTTSFLPDAAPPSDPSTIPLTQQHPPPPSPTQLICLCRHAASTLPIFKSLHPPYPHSPQVNAPPPPMLAQCHNPLCSISWFHYNCLTRSAKMSSQYGRWLCDTCRASRAFMGYTREVPKGTMRVLDFEDVVRVATRLERGRSSLLNWEAAWTKEEILAGVEGLKEGSGGDVYGLGGMASAAAATVVKEKGGEMQVGALASFELAVSEPYWVSRAYGAERDKYAAEFIERDCEEREEYGRSDRWVVNERNDEGYVEDRGYLEEYEGDEEGYGGDWDGIVGDDDGDDEESVEDGVEHADEASALPLEEIEDGDEEISLHSEDDSESESE